jgi:hypothetical protein
MTCVPDGSPGQKFIRKTPVVTQQSGPAVQRLGQSVAIGIGQRAMHELGTEGRGL